MDIDIPGYYMATSSFHVASGKEEKHSRPELCHIASREGDTCSGNLIFSTREGFLFPVTSLRKVTDKEKKRSNQLRKGMGLKPFFADVP